MKKSVSLLIVALLLLSSMVLGCADKTNTSITGAPSSSAVDMHSIKGTVQGRLLDRVTLQPIAGAVIDIGVAQTTTTADGQFVLLNVPATEAGIITNPQSASGTNAATVTTTYQQDYYATINMKGVTSPINMADPAAKHYPEYKYERIQVHYETIGNIVSAESGSTGGVYVVDIQDVSTQEIMVGKLAATITGVVAGCSGAEFFNNVGAGYTVKLIATSLPADNSGSGNNGNVVMTATTDASGAFTLSNVESGESFMVCAGDANNTMFGCADGNAATAPNYVTLVNVDPVTAPSDNQTKTLTIQGSTAVHACSTDIHGPSVVLITPEVGSDNTPGATTVKFKFSEPVMQTAMTTTTAGIPGNIFDTIEVGYLGNKAGNLAYSLAWNAAFDELSVNLTTMAAGMFYVRIADIETKFTDASLNSAEMGMCPDDSAVPGAYGLVALGGVTDCTAYFTANGALTATAPSSVVITNLSTLDATGTAPTLDWIATTGSKSYNIYKKIYQWPGYPVATSGAITTAGAQVSTEFFVANTANTAYTGGVEPLIEGDNIPLAVTYTVKGVNADGIESATGATANASDKVTPNILTAPTIADMTDGNNTISMAFNEDMDETKAETSGNYTITSWTGFTAASISSLQYTGAAVGVTFTDLEVAIVAGTNECASTAAADDVQTIAVTVATCVQNGADGTQESVLGGDDVACVASAANTTDGICAGPNGICNTAAAGTDSLITASGSVPRCVTRGTNNVIDAAVGGGDVKLNAIQTISLGTSITDVAGNSIDTTANGVDVVAATGATTIN